MGSEMQSELRLLDPSSWNAEESRKLAQRVADVHGDAQVRESTRRNAANRQAYDALRSSFLKIPGMQDALSKRQLVQPARQAVAPHGPSLRAPLVRLDEHIVETPPFLTMTGYSQNGPNTVAFNADPSGSAIVSIQAGVEDSTTGNGTASVWAALGSSVIVPAATSSVQFRITCDFNWESDWSSSWWRLAAGDVWVGQLVNRFTTAGLFIDTPVASQLVQPDSVFNDYNLDDNGYQVGSASPYTQSSIITNNQPVRLDCFLWIGGYASAQPGDSTAHVVMAAGLTALEIDIF